MKDENKDKNVIKLCCGGRGCPTIECNDGIIIITDEQGNKVTLTKEEASLIPSALRKL